MADYLTMEEDCKDISSAAFVPWEDLRGKAVLVTGATGLIGFNTVNALCYANENKWLDMTVIALVRDIDRAKQRFPRYADSVQWFVGDVTAMSDMDMQVDYIIHGAGPTASSFFVTYPVETVKNVFLGASNMLELARKKKVKGFAFLSTMEVYGTGIFGNQLYESSLIGLDQMSVRSCYPEVKRLCENLCVGYHVQHSVPTRIVRLAQTFGPGVLPDDNRVFVQFARAVANRSDIILQTQGESKRVYLYTADAVTAILTVLLKGEDAQAYNAGNPKTYCSIADMANLVAKEVAKSKIDVRIPEVVNSEKMYSPLHSYNLNVDKLMGLGWKPTRALAEMYSRMIKHQTDSLQGQL